MGSQNSRSNAMDGSTTRPENCENSINFLNSNSSMHSKRNVKSRQKNFETTNDQENKDEHGNINNIVDTSTIERQKQMLNNLRSGSGVGNQYTPGYCPNNNNHLNNADTYTEINYNHHQKECDSMDSPEQATNVYKKQKNANFVQMNDSSTLKINDTNFENSESYFTEEAPEIPFHLLCIPFLSEKEKKINRFWKSNDVPKVYAQEMDIERGQEQNNSGFLRIFENSNSLPPPTHVVINHLGLKKNTSKNYCSYSFTQRYKGKYATLKFYTFK